MTNENATIRGNARASRCAKILEYVKNRNRIVPARIRANDCDFFVVGPRRTIRILMPVPRVDPREVRDEIASDDAIIVEENYVARHSRDCSFASAGRLSGPVIATDLDAVDEIAPKVTGVEPRRVDKNKIVKNLEEYIERLLREVLGDTMRFFREDDRKLRTDDPPPGDSSAPIDTSESGQGRVNPAFVGTIDDPDSLDFRIERSGNIENFDWTDSGINSVETAELQSSSREISLEQSLMDIMDAKFGIVRDGSADDNEASKLDESRQNPKDLTCAEDTIVPSLSQPLEKQENLKVVEERSPIKLVETIDESETSEITERLDEKIVHRFGRKECENETPASTMIFRPENVSNRSRHRKPLLVFIHGYGSSAEVFEHQLEYFSSLGYPCLAPELLGHGLSSAPDRPRDYRFDRLLGDLEAVLQHYAFASGRKCVLVAHNYGCSFASALACKYERNIDRLVLISGGGPTPLAPPSHEGPARCCLRAFLSPLLVCGLRRDVLYAARGRQHPYCGPETIEQRPSHMRYVLEGMSWPEGDCVFHRRITTPTLLIHGLRDDEVSLVQECQMERTIIKAFLDAIPTAGHTPMVDCPERVNHTIHCFVDLWKRRRR